MDRMSAESEGKECTRSGQTANRRLRELSLDGQPFYAPWPETEYAERPFTPLSGTDTMSVDIIESQIMCALKGSRPLNILLWGVPGTGKTTRLGDLASRNRISLYRVDGEDNADELNLGIVPMVTVAPQHGRQGDFAALGSGIVAAAVSGEVALVVIEDLHTLASFSKLYALLDVRRRITTPLGCVPIPDNVVLTACANTLHPIPDAVLDRFRPCIHVQPPALIQRLELVYGRASAGTLGEGSERQSPSRAQACALEARQRAPASQELRPLHEALTKSIVELAKSRRQESLTPRAMLAHRQLAEDLFELHGRPSDSLGIARIVSWATQTCLYDGAADHPGCTGTPSRRA